MEILLLSFSLAAGILLTFTGLARSIGIPSQVDLLARQYVRPLSLEQVELAEPFGRRVLRPALRGLARMVSRATPQQIMQTIHVKLDLAGNPYDLPALEFLGVCVLFAVLNTLSAGLVSSLLNASFVVIVLVMIAGAALGLYLPVLWLNMKIRARQEDITIALPDALDLLTVCVEAGQGFDGAMAQVGDKWDNELSRAFKRGLAEIRLGKTRQAALRDMANRAQVRELTNFVAALLQAERFGSGIAQVLRVQAEQMRVLRRQRAQTIANQMPIKLVFPLVFCLFPALFIVLLGPAVLRLLASVIV
ncbi:MAG: type II secretion system F family protein [Chloroflexi bacterium]|nr:type II secretion system F family protein [Chloroflexota bacterium]